MLLIITNRDDLASDYLIHRLREINIPFARFNTDQYPETVSIDIEFNKSSFDYTLTLGDQRIASSAITSVYFRQPIAPTFPEGATEVERLFAETELLETMRSLWRAIPEELWLNHPKKLWIAANKVEQLLVAQKIGFRIPETLITSSPERIRGFFVKKNGKIVAKAVKHGFMQSGDEVLLAGTQILPDDFLSQLESYAQVPMTFQEKLEIDVDVRVVVVGDSIFPASIAAKQNPEVTDWRISDIIGDEIVYERINLPEEIKQSCLDITRYFHLNYSSIDLVKDKQGNFIFLELNPNGQWGWIEQNLDYPIRDTIIDKLLNIAKR